MKLRDLKDGQSFKLNERRISPSYELQSKEDNIGVITSNSKSKRTFRKKLSTVVYPLGKKKGKLKKSGLRLKQRNDLDVTFG